MPNISIAPVTPAPTFEAWVKGGSDVIVVKPAKNWRAWIASKYSPDQLRDELGRWAEEGGGGEAGTGEAGGTGLDMNAPKPPVNGIPRVRRVAPTTPISVDESGGDTPEEWDQVDEDTQGEVRDRFIEDSMDGEVDSQMEMYKDDGQAAKDQGETLADDSTWLEETIRGTEWDNPLTVTEDSLVAAVSLDWNSRRDEMSVEWDDSKLVGIVADDPNQEDFQFAADYVKPNLISDAFRDEVDGWVTQEFEKEVENRVDNMDTPNWIYDQARESLDSYWNEIDDDEKFRIAERYDLLKEGESTRIAETFAADGGVEITRFKSDDESEMKYEIRPVGNEADEPLELDVDLDRSGVLHIGSLNVKGESTDAKLPIGVQGVRAIVRRLMADFPSAVKLSTSRITGVRGRLHLPTGAELALAKSDDRETLTIKEIRKLLVEEWNRATGTSEPKP